jgi:hypothetical protein
LVNGPHLPTLVFPRRHFPNAGTGDDEKELPMGKFGQPSQERKGFFRVVPQSSVSHNADLWRAVGKTQTVRDSSDGSSKHSGGPQRSALPSLWSVTSADSPVLPLGTSSPPDLRSWLQRFRLRARGPCAERDPGQKPHRLTEVGTVFFWHAPSAAQLGKVSASDKQEEQNQSAPSRTDRACSIAAPIATLPLV